MKTLVKFALYLLLPLSLLVIGVLTLAPLNVASASSMDEQIPISSAPSIEQAETIPAAAVLDEDIAFAGEEAILVESVSNDDTTVNSSLVIELQEESKPYVAIDDSDFLTRTANSPVQSKSSNGLEEFVQSVTTGNRWDVTGVFVPGSLALEIRQQPAGSPGYVSTEDSVVTQFGMAADYGSIALLAHNYLAGAKFFELSAGVEVYLVYGDGRVEGFVITNVRRLRALQPYSPYSDFLDLDNNNAKLSAVQLFYQVYDQPGKIILQTCINSEGIDAWGRLFVMAEPLS
jgi:hypothetical protein